MKQYRAIFWDNDGILVDTEPLYAQAVQQVFDRLGFSADAEKLYLEYTVRQGRHVWDQIREKLNLSESQINDLRAERDENYETLLSQEIPIIPGAKEVLLQLKSSSLSLVLVTSCLRHHLDMIHEKTGFFDFFDFILAREDFAHSKPHPEPYETAFQKLKQRNNSKISKSDILVIEDSERGLLSAKEAGLECWVIPTKFTQNMDFSRADKRLHSIREVPSLLGIMPQQA